MPAKESKAPSKAAAKVAKAAAPAKAASKGAKKGGKRADGKGAKKGAKPRKPVRVGAKGIKGYKGNLKAKSQVKESIQRLSLRKKAKKMVTKNPNAKNSKAYKELKKQAVNLKVRLNKVPTRADASRARTAVMSRAQGWKNGQAPHRTIRKGRLHSWREGNPLFINRPRNMGIGGNIRPKTDLKRFVKWPKYIRVQRQKRILLERLKVPPSINQFRKPTRRNHALNLFRFLRQYKPEESGARQKRLLKAAREKAAGKKGDKYKRPITVTTGLQHTTRMILNKTAKLVLIAADVDPIEIVIAIPTLCRKMDVPYMIVRGKARMGALVGMKTCTTIAVPKLKPEHDKQLSNFINLARKRFNDNVESRKQWGGLKLGPKSRQRIEKQRRLVKMEARIRRRADAEKKKARAGL